VRTEGEGVQLWRVQSREKFARWLLFTREVVVVGMGLIEGEGLLGFSGVCLDTLLAVRVRLTEGEGLLGVSRVCLDTVLAVRVRLTAGDELVGVSW